MSNDVPACTGTLQRPPPSRAANSVNKFAENNIKSLRNLLTSIIFYGHNCLQSVIETKNENLKVSYNCLHLTLDFETSSAIIQFLTSLFDKQED